MTTSSALDSFLDKWRTRWPEWSVAEPFVPEAQRLRVVAWFALLQEFDDILNIGGDPTPADAKLAWWGEELRSWAAQRSRHPLGRVLEPLRAPWAELAQTLPDLIDARAVPVDPAQALAGLRAYAAAVAAVEAVIFETPVRGDAATPVLLQTLAQRLNEAGIAAVPRAVLAQGDQDVTQRWAQQLLRDWPARVAGPGAGGCTFRLVSADARAWG
uniref:squalene/phytoene synthase family protein n=1 Tax=Stenotrophomonas sp. GZD-301 TaxID=3404814 RepID=UPI003BB7B4A5